MTTPTITGTGYRARNCPERPWSITVSSSPARRRARCRSKQRKRRWSIRTPRSDGTPVSSSTTGIFPPTPSIPGRTARHRTRSGGPASWDPMAMSPSPFRPTITRFPALISSPAASLRRPPSPGAAWNGRAIPRPTPKMPVSSTSNTRSISGRWTMSNSASNGASANGITNRARSSRQPASPANIYDPFPVSNFLAGSGANVPKTWLVPDTNRFFNAFFPQSLLNGPLQPADLRNSYIVKERIAAGYAMTKVETSLFGMPLHGDLGIRFASTDETSFGHATTAANAIVPVSYDRPYFNALPSASLVLDVTDDLLVRASAAKVVTRPSLTSVAPSINLNANPLVPVASGGNPNLAPYEAKTYDATVEWYFAPHSALIGDVFYKDVNSFIYNQLSPLAVDGITYLLSAPVNGGFAHILGGELAYQQLFHFLPEPFDGLGMLANLTLTSSNALYHDTTTGRTFQDAVSGVARHSFNLTGFYEKGPYALRATYSWTGDVLEQVGTFGYSDVNNSAFGTLNLNASYSLNDNLSFTLEGVNVLDAAQRQFPKGGSFASYFNYGRSILAGVRFKY